MAFSARMKGYVFKGLLMVGRRFLFVVFLLALGFGPATAQDVYINHYKNKEPGRRTSVYINRGDSDARKSYRSRRQSYTARSKYQDKLKLSRDAKDTAGKIDIFYAWQDSGRKPKTQEEILSYADAKRAVAEGAVFQRRRELIAYLEQQDRAEARRLARGDMSGGRTERSAFSSGGANINKTKRVHVRKPVVHVKPKKNSGSPSGRIFNSYR